MNMRLKPSSSIVLGGVAVAAMVTLSAAATPAQARTAHHHQMHQGNHHRAAHRSTHGQRYATASHRRQDGPARVSAADTPGEGQRSMTGAGGGDIVNEARRWLGGNPTHRSSLWCAAFMNFVLERTGHHGSGSNLARSFASYGRRVSGPQVGAIAVMGRKGGGHVGVVSGFDAAGNPIIISGNHGHRVAESVYPGGRIFAYVMP
jgi:uncharacterized protein (TIGR02594 family)